MRIFAAGIGTETNTFASVPTTLEDFAVQRGSPAEAQDGADITFDLPRIWGSLAQARGAEFVFSLMAFAQPGGMTARAAYESLRDEMLEDLRRAMPVDVVLLMLHGAMVADGYDDCEEDMIRRVRQIVGPAAIIGAELDLHCHLRESTLALANLIITYKEYPHVDVNERARELFDLSVAAHLGKIRPTMALFDCRMIGLYPTSRSPLRELVDAMNEVERRPGILSISFVHGFQFADVPHMGAKMLVVTDNDPALAARTARELGRRVYESRHSMGFESISLPLDQALSKAMASDKRPVVVADQSDNVGGGAPGDATFALRWLLDQQATDVGLAIMYDPQVVSIARKAGPGARLQVRLGGKTSPLSGDPLDLEVTLLRLLEDYRHTFSQASGEAVSFRTGDVAALRCGSIDIVVSSERCQCYGPGIFSDLGIDPLRKRLLVVKSAQHFYGSFAPIAGEVIYMAAPGAVAPDPRRLSYRNLDCRRLYPWAEDPLAT